MSITNTQEAVMSKSVPAQHPAVVLRSQYRNLRSLLAVAMVALVGLSTTVVVLAIDDGGTTTSTSSVQPVSRSYPTLDDPFQSQTQQTRPQGGPEESAVAAAIASKPPVSGPDESKIAAAISSHKPVSPYASVSRPDESKIAAALAEQSDTGPAARARAYQEKLSGMTQQEKDQAFVNGH
jgi:hypothetical protein